MLVDKKTAIIAAVLATAIIALIHLGNSANDQSAYDKAISDQADMLKADGDAHGIFKTHEEWEQMVKTVAENRFSHGSGADK